MTLLIAVIVHQTSPKMYLYWFIVVLHHKSCCVEMSASIVLNQVLGEWSSGTFQLKPGDEDIHTANERRLKVSFTVLSVHSLRSLIRHSWAEQVKVLTRAGDPNSQPFCQQSFNHRAATGAGIMYLLIGFYDTAWHITVYKMDIRRLPK